ncbi:MAG: O-antigen ligase family protein [Clostridia bacterium]|nr:O-antigen ligase family protein [Clostridia bacterium]
MKQKSGRAARGGIAGAICDRIGESFGKGMVSGFLGSYGKMQRALENSFLYRKLAAGKNGRLRLRLKAASAIESSLIVNMRASFLRLLSELPAKAYPAFFLAFAILSSSLEIIKCYLAGSFVPSEFISVSLAVYSAVFITFPMFFTEKSLSELLSRSRFFRPLLTERAGILPEKLGRPALSGGAVPFAVLFGLIIGGMSWFSSPDRVIGINFLLIVLSLLTDYPEIGVKFLIFATPFLSLFERPSLLLGIMLTAVVVGWLAKLLRGRRSLYLGLSDIPVLFLGLAVLLSGFTGGKDFSFRTAMLETALMLGFFLCSNLVRSRDSLFGAAAALSVSATAAAFIGIAQFVSGGAPLDWLDSGLFPGIAGRAVSLFGNPNMLAVYLSMAFPSSLMFVTEGRGKLKFAGIISCASIAVCSVLTFSRSGWLGMAAGFIVFLLFESPRGLLAVPVAAAPVAALSFVFPDSLGARLGNFISFYDSANAYRIHVWNGAAKLAKHYFFTGAGAGDIVFRELFVFYADPGTAAAPHSHSLWLQLLIQTGIGGLLFFAAAGILLSVKAVSLSREGRRAGDVTSVRLCAAFLSGAISISVSGFFDYTLYNYRVFFIFCCLAGLASAAADCCRKSAERSELGGY